jgi:hypothetical protein
MVDYSRWQNWEKETEQQEVEEQRLRELYELQQTNPEKIEELKTDLQKLKENVQQEATNAIPQRQAKEVTTKLRTEAKSMKEKLKKLKEKEQEMEEQQRKLDQLMSAGDPASIMKFFESQGMNINDIQKMIGGSDMDTKDVIRKTATQKAKAFSKEEEEEIDNTLKVTSQLEQTFLGNAGTVEEDLRAQELAKKQKERQEQRAQQKPEKQTIIPEYSQLIPSKGKNKGHIVVKIKLGLLHSAGDCQLDISVTQFRLFAPTPDGKANYLLNFSLRCPVNPSATVAKWIKKDSTLKVVLDHA